MKAYLEAVTDFIVLGEGIMWQQNTDGVKFLDSENVVAHAIAPLHQFELGICNRNKHIYKNNSNIV